VTFLPLLSRKCLRPNPLKGATSGSVSSSALSESLSWETKFKAAVADGDSAVADNVLEIANAFADDALGFLLDAGVTNFNISDKDPVGILMKVIAWRTRRSLQAPCDNRRWRWHRCCFSSTNC
jgi:hypothetical protein